MSIVILNSECNTNHNYTNYDTNTTSIINTTTISSTATGDYYLFTTIIELA